MNFSWEVPCPCRAICVEGSILPDILSGGIVYEEMFRGEMSLGEMVRGEMIRREMVYGEMIRGKM
jgi:hypothetical protein